MGVLRFVDAGTKALELENGQALNEPTTYAVRVAIEQAVYDMIVEGEKKGIWRYKKPGQASRPEEVKVEEKKDVVVQSQTKSETETKTIPSAPTEVKKETAPVEKLSGEMILKEASYIYKETDVTSQKTWQFKKGALVTIIGQEGEWIEVRDSQKRRGFVKKDVLANKP